MYYDINDLWEILLLAIVAVQVQVTKRQYFLKKCVYTYMYEYCRFIKMHLILLIIYFFGNPEENDSKILGCVDERYV